jgi:hypothetical protein
MQTLTILGCLVMFGIYFGSAIVQGKDGDLAKAILSGLLGAMFLVAGVVCYAG